LRPSNSARFFEKVNKPGAQPVRINGPARYLGGDDSGNKHRATDPKAALPLPNPANRVQKTLV